MLALYQSLASIANSDFSDIVSGTEFVGGTFASPNKLRLTLTEGSFIDIWISDDGDYAFHWERRRQTGKMYRWDNAPHHPQISTHPAHFHNGDEATIEESNLSEHMETALHEVLEFVQQVK